ncbi:MFS transporter [Chloroflexota bacterium]
MPSIFQIKDRIFYGWVVVVALITSSLIMVGVNSSFGVFFKSLEGTFGLTRAATSAILSCRLAFSCIFAFLGGWAMDRYGPRVVFSFMGFFIGLSLILTGQALSIWHLFITYSLLLAIGVGATFVVTTATVLRWFNRKRGLALGIAGSGSGLGTAFIAPLSAFLIGSFEWRNASMILGGIAWLVILPFSQLLKKDPYEIGALPDGATSRYPTLEVELGKASPQKIPLLRMLLTTSFLFFLFIWILMSLSSFTVMTHIVPHSIDMGFSAIESATILSLSGIAMVAGRFIAGVITDKVRIKIVAIIFSIFQFIAVLWLVWAQELWMLYLFGLVHGFTLGGFGTSMLVLIGRTFGLEDIGKILGVLEIGIYVGGIIGPFIGGLIFDVSNSYTLAFLIMAGLILVRITLVLLIGQITWGKGKTSTLRYRLR